MLSSYLGAEMHTVETYMYPSRIQLHRQGLLLTASHPALVHVAHGEHEGGADLLLHQAVRLAIVHDDVREVALHSQMQAHVVIHDLEPCCGPALAWGGPKDRRVAQPGAEAINRDAGTCESTHATGWVIMHHLTTQV